MSSLNKKSTPPHVQDLDLDYLVSVFASNVFTSNTTDPGKGPSFCRLSQFCDSLGLVDADSCGRPSTSRLREEYEELPDDADTSPLPEDDNSLHGELRKEDIELLRLLSVRRICDLMVEGKKEKYRLKMTSSEKVDSFKRYRDFTIFKLPYPGCEFFEKYVKQHYNPEGLFYDWTQDFVDVELDVPDTSVASELNIDWNNYKSWDLIQLTKNYLKFLLKVIMDDDSSLLVHCISGWDRTALFISMLRLSLWADNMIHQSLSALEMAYLTTAYDWFLFSHNLPDRVQKFEEIFYFCFNMLKYISAEEFSTLNLKSIGDTSSESAGTSTASGNEKACEEDPPGFDVVSVESISLLLVPSEPQTGKLSDIHESWQVIKETGSTDSSLSSDADCDPNTSRSNGTPSSKELSLKLRRERLEEVRLLVTKAYLNMRAEAANRQASPRLPQGYRANLFCRQCPRRLVI
ncbi:hypothetical protein MTO96_006041 [Rhipicephalus appendiculatus]